MQRLNAIEKLAKMLSYVLGRHPDEFGLVTNREGWVKIKDVLHALGEESGWRHVRTAHLNEVLLTHPDPPVEVVDGRIRARVRSRLPPATPSPGLPKLLYTCVRTRAHSTTMTHGIQPGESTPVILSSNPEMAARIGRRRDPHPVTLTVNVQQALAAGVTFEGAGAALFTAGAIPPQCFTGPPLPKEAPEPQRQRPKAEAVAPSPGSFVLDPERLRGPRQREKPKGTHQENGWKKRNKRGRREPPPWRR